MHFPNLVSYRKTFTEKIKERIKNKRNQLLCICDSVLTHPEKEDCSGPAHRVPFRLAELYDVIPGRLAFTVHGCQEETISEVKSRAKSIYFFSTDLQERFEPFCADFGPVKLSVVYRFCEFVQNKIDELRLANRNLAYYCDPHPEIIANTCFLLGCYAMLHWNFSPEQAFAAFSRISTLPLPEFRDATYMPADYTISLLDCFRGVRQALSYGWYCPKRFDVEEYEFWDDEKNGDLHEMNPRFIAFRGPQSACKEFGATLPEHYVEVFKEKSVQCVVRLNDRETYDARKFTEHNIRHHDLFFEDCGVPSPQLVKRFLDICDNEKGRIAVHCKAGLGRTGTMIGLWMIRKLGWKADATIAWLRIVRPGSVIGDQQHFLKTCEACPWNGNLPLPLEETSHSASPEQPLSDVRSITDDAVKGRIVRFSTSVSSVSSTESSSSACLGRRTRPNTALQPGSSGGSRRNSCLRSPPDSPTCKPDKVRVETANKEGPILLLVPQQQPASSPNLAVQSATSGVRIGVFQ